MIENLDKFGTNDRTSKKKVMFENQEVGDQGIVFIGPCYYYSESKLVAAL